MWLRMAKSGGRQSPQAFAGTRTSTQELARSGKKKAQPKTVGLGVDGGGGGNRTRVRKPSTGSSTYLVRCFCALALVTPAEQAELWRVALI